MRRDSFCPGGVTAPVDPSAGEIDADLPGSVRRPTIEGLPDGYRYGLPVTPTSSWRRSHSTHLEAQGAQSEARTAAFALLPTVSDVSATEAPHSEPPSLGH